MQNLSKIIGAVLLIICFAGCAVRQADLTAISTKNVELNGVDLNTLHGKRVEGEDSNFLFLFIPFGFPQLEDAVDDALAKGNGDLIVDAVIYSERWWFLVGQDIIKIKGTVVNTKETK